jgi:hypothetical protein
MKIAAKIMKPNGILASLEPRNALLAAWTVATNITNHIGASRKSIAQPSVALVTGGAVIGFDDRVHIDLDRSHTVLSPDEARQFANELKRIADVIDPLSQGG